jgi:hypothetical protein
VQRCKLIESMKATSILKCWAIARHACQIDGVDKSIEHFKMLGTHQVQRYNLMESMKATSILKCWAIARHACQIDGVDKSIEHFKMLGTHQVQRYNLMCLSDSRWVFQTSVDVTNLSIYLSTT